MGANCPQENFSMRPFVKWAGGKRRLVSELLSYFNLSVDHYFEPFLGGGAVAIHLLSNSNIDNFHLSDLNSPLINAYKSIATDFPQFKSKLLSIQTAYNALRFEDRENFFYKSRSMFNSNKSPELLIFLNKTCFNGLYRVNRRGEFNVPWGKSKKHLDFDLHNMEELSKLFTNRVVDFKDCSFEEVVEMGKKSMVYLDPPYEGTFKEYTASGFKLLDKLAQYVDYLDGQGVAFVMSNSKHESVVEKFGKKYHIVEIEAPRVISCRGGGRQSVKELVVTNQY